MTLEPQKGVPSEEGRYVAFVRCESYQVKDWLEPEIATYAGGRWHNRRHVFAWLGPLPLCKWADFKGPDQRPCAMHCNNPKCDATRCFGKLEYDL